MKRSISIAAALMLCAPHTALSMKIDTQTAIASGALLAATSLALYHYYCKPRKKIMNTAIIEIETRQKKSLVRQIPDTHGSSSVFGCDEECLPCAMIQGRTIENNRLTLTPSRDSADSDETGIIAFCRRKNHLPESENTLFLFPREHGRHTGFPISTTLETRAKNHLKKPDAISYEVHWIIYRNESDARNHTFYESHLMHKPMNQA